MKMKYKLIVANLAVLASLHGAVQAQSTTRDRFKTDKCYSTDGKEMPCAAPVEVKFPNAKRVAPEFPKTKIAKEWNVLVKATESKNPEVLITAAQAVLNHPDASINEKSEAANQVAQGYLMQDKTSYLKPIEYSIKAIDTGGLNNNAHYSLMFVLSQMLMAEKKYQEALVYGERYSKETGVDDLAVAKLRGNCLYRLARYPEAATVLRKAYDLDKGTDPNLATMLMDAYNKTGQKAEANKIAEEVAKTASASAAAGDSSAQIKQLLVLANAKQYDKAAKIFDDLYAKGQISTLAEYEAGYVSYSYLEGKEAQAIKIINDGMGKGIIKPDAGVYNILAQSYYYTDQPKSAIESWGKAADLSPKGAYDVLQARVYAEESDYAKAKAAAQRGLSKGVDNKGDAYLIIAESESEFGLDNRAAMIAALKEAAKDPETQAEANKRLKQAGAK